MPYLTVSGLKGALEGALPSMIGLATELVEAGYIVTINSTDVHLVEHPGYSTLVWGTGDHAGEPVEVEEDFTADGVLIKPGLIVWNNDLRVSVVKDRQKYQNPAESVWYDMVDANGEYMSMMNGSRMTTRHPRTGALAAFDGGEGAAS
jgi:hypothetical protein